MTIATDNISLDLIYLGMVDSMASQSKDRSTGIGAVLKPLGMAKQPILACNALPFGLRDSDARSERPAKYLYWEHAERNVLYCAARAGISTSGATLYTTGVPCADCARAVIQAGVRTVVVWQRGSGLEATDRWFESINAGREMLKEAGVLVREVARP